MLVLSLNAGHDGAAAVVEDGRLVLCLEAEKGSRPRHAALDPSTLATALELCPGFPDVVAVGGWRRHLPGGDLPIAAGYEGLTAGTPRQGRLMGRPVTWFSSTHERSHVAMAAAMGPQAPYDECIVLVWEGTLGAFYHWQQGGALLQRHEVLREPGARYAALLALADPAFPDAGGFPQTEAAGKVMALAGHATGPPTAAERAAVARLLELPTTYPLDKAAFRDTPLHNAGGDVPCIHRAAAHVGDEIFRRFERTAERVLPRGLPLLIAGGCGLNCDWNRRWLDGGLFDDVFVAPCADDSGSAIGTAADALQAVRGRAALKWDAYRGVEFHDDLVVPGGWERRALDHEVVARRLADGGVIAWVEGRAEIGPRALGHRSLLASPLDATHRDRLNRIKRRESYRPIAPCCLSEDLELHFDDPVDDPHMLFFSRVRDARLPAVTHADGSARVQSVRPSGPSGLRRLLGAFKGATGVGVLCNTSLNFHGRGFVNSGTELFQLAEQVGIDDVVIAERWYRRQ